MNRVSMALASLALAAVPQATAQVSGQGGTIRVNADKSEVIERQHQVILIDNVDIMQGNARLRADRITLNYTGNGNTETSGLSGFGDISSMEAVGEVFYVTPELKATGDRGVYQSSSDTITLTGNVVLIRGEDVATGERLVMRLSEGRTVLDGGTGQVQMNINPNQIEDSDDDASN
ncbi:LptA/OstA family protein [Henriciella aquimarina]|uniref:LptA/OstA family protein n=1 Tax=Henriciella aquimarina TaxID=545261 RepID=UPI000A046E56|nr:LptA/OstA family protein [Henriciella aquimarina]